MRTEEVIARGNEIRSRQAKRNMPSLPEWEEGTIEAFHKGQVEQDLKQERVRMRQRVVPCSNTTCDDEAVLSRIKYAQIPRMYDIWGAPVLDNEPDHHVFRCPTCGWATKRKGNGNARNN